MSKIQYKHLDLAGASLIQRRHERQTIPPGMFGATNLLPSRSDTSLSLRPDFVQENTTIFGVSSGLQIQNFDETLDSLNIVHGLYGSDNLIWFTSYIPWGYYGTAGAEQILSSVMETGRASGTDNSYSVSFNNLGSYDIRIKWWRGCLLEFNGDGNYYVLDSIFAGDPSAQTGTVVLTMPTQSDYSNEIDYLGAAYKWTSSGGGANEYYLELTGGGDPTAIDPVEVLLDDVSLVKGTVGSLADETWGYGDGDTLGYDTVYIADATGDPDVSGVTLVGRQGHTYTLYRTHNSMRANNNKLSIDEFAGALIYCSPTIEDNFSAEDVCGPFYVNVTESDWQYNVNGYTSTQDLVSGSDENYLNYNYGLATTGTSWIVLPWADVNGFYRTLDITDDNTWSWFDFADLTWNLPQPNTDDVFPGDPTDATNHVRFDSIRRNSSLGFMVSGQVQLSSVIAGTNKWYPAVIYSTDQGYTWTVKIDEDNGLSGAASGVACHGCEYNGTTIFMVSYKSGTGYLRYSTDGGGTWNNCTGTASVTGGSAGSRVKYTGGQFVFMNKTDGKMYHSSDGQAFTEKDISGDITSFDCYDVAYNGGDGGTDYWVAVDDANSLIGRSTTVGGTYTDVTPDWIDDLTRYDADLNYVFYDQLGHRFIIPGGAWLGVSADYGATWQQNLSGFDEFAPYASPSPSNIDWSGQIMATMYSDYGSSTMTHISIDRSYTISWEVDLFVPLSDDYRATTFSVIDGYMVLIGTREWNSGTGEWDYNHKRIRWSVPGTYSDFAGSGSGTADATGPGSFLVSFVVNGRIVILETNRVSAIVPRGDTDDPFDFDVIKDDFKFLSNPVVVNDVAYIIGSDGLLWSTDGINCDEVGASFDLTKFDDYTEDKPVWLVFSRGENALYVFYRDSSSTTHPAYCISIAAGSVTQVDLLEVDNSVVKSEKPAAIVSIDGSTKQDVYVTHHPFSQDTDLVGVARLRVGDIITGTDYLNSSEFGYWSGSIESGELFITQEGEKSSVKHLIVETYTTATTGDNTDTPYLTAEVKSIEDSAYVTLGDTNGTATMTTSALTGSGTAWSTTIAVAADHPTIDTEQECGAGKVEFTLPCIASQARVYIDDVLYENYTTSSTEITCAVSPASSSTLKAYWENVPEVKVKVGDMFKSSEGWHRVTRIDSAENIILDHYLSTGSETVTHYPAWQLDDGHGRTELGINRLVEGVQIRLYLIPDYDGTQQSTVAKITGLSIGYVQQGHKIVKATGS